ncbi:MAG: hypothetical protein U0359_21135 [Byssovorax sp.]
MSSIYRGSVCPDCGGSGRIETCAACGGTGTLLCDLCTGSGQRTVQKDGAPMVVACVCERGYFVCAACSGGTGVCGRCAGSGMT